MPAIDQRRHDHRAIADAPGWSLLRLSAGLRLAMALGIAALLWLATLAVIT